MVLQSHLGVKSEDHDGLGGPLEAVPLTEVDRECGDVTTTSVEERDGDVEVGLVQSPSFKQCHIRCCREKIYLHMFNYCTGSGSMHQVGAWHALQYQQHFWSGQNYD